MPSKSSSFPAPVGGWNARDSIASMDEKDAYSLINWFPNTTDVQIRNGNVRWSTGLPSQVNSLFVYNGSSSSKMFAASGTAFYDVTTQGAVGASVVSGLTNDKWQHTNMGTAGGQFLMCVNGTDKMRYYDGATWSTEGTTYTITNVNTNVIKDIFVFKNRVWLVEKASLSVWYLPTSSIAGAAAEIDISGIVQKGGYLVSGATWTIDAGNGIDDHLVLVTSNGEVVVYRGTDPASITTWSLVGVFQIGSPVGQRCLKKYQGDLLIISQDGLLPLSSALQSSRVNPRVALSDKIQYATSAAISSYGTSFGWDLLHFPKENMLILNVPIAAGQQEQYAMNTISQSWGRFQGWYANCWALFNDNPYYGANGVVYKAWTGNSDFDTSGTEINISYDCQQAFNYCKDRIHTKHWKMMRPILQTTGGITPLAGVNTDFDSSTPQYTLGTSTATTSVWDTAVWDTGVWGGALELNQDWQVIGGIGRAAAPRIVGAQKGIDVRWIATDVIYETGGFL